MAAALGAALVGLAALADVAPAQVCTITGDLKLCGGAAEEICGPPGMVSYSWTGPGGFTATTQCITVSVVGAYELTTVDTEQNTLTCLANVTEVPPPTCAITAPGGTSLCAAGSVELCGPPDMTAYKWTGPADFAASTQCITVTAAGIYTITITNEDGCEATCEETVTGDGATCTISGSLEICPGQTTQLCGPEGADTYSWTGPGAFMASTRCITVDVPGPYQLTLAFGAECTATCTVTVAQVECPGENCPRTPGFWSAQCAQREGGSTKFTREQMDQITACVDEASAYFDWPSDFDGFCAVVDPSGRMDIRKQTLRHYAVLLANACAGDLGMVAGNGEIVVLDLDTPIDCEGLGGVGTIGALIDEVEARLAELHGEELTEEVKHSYEQLKSCMDAINNGVGIGPTCRHDGGDEDEDQGEGGDVGGRRDGARGGRSALALRAAPNPFNGSVAIDYVVPSPGEAPVSVAIYDVAGRLVRQLVSATAAPGAYTARWNGRDATGRALASGVYYARAQVGGLEAVTRVLLVQ